VALSARFEKEGQRPGANGPFTIRGETASGLRAPPARCCSSVVEHSLGKGEVVSSILTNSTIFLPSPSKHEHKTTGGDAKAKHQNDVAPYIEETCTKRAGPAGKII
jgi:hypothetical protein